MGTKTSICKGIKMNNSPCKRNTSHESGFCPSHHHQSKIKSSHLEESQCSICLDHATPADALECGHMIHRNCLKLTHKVECPVCRIKLVNIPIRLREIIERNAFRYNEESDGEIMSLVFNLMRNFFRRDPIHIIDGLVAYHDEISGNIRIFFDVSAESEITDDL